MGLQCGIVGLPNVGKSTLFKAITNAKAEAANYPFCTIDPNVGVVSVPDARLNQICEFVKPKSIVPTVIEFVDIAGLVKGASEGQGLGNQFLGHIRQTDAIIHVVRCFDDSNIIHVEGSVDPLRDIDIINTELLLADLETVQKRLSAAEKKAKGSTDRKVKLEAELLKKLNDALGSGKPARTVVAEEEDAVKILKELHLLTSKPVLYLCNVDEDSLKNGGNDWTKQVETRAKEENNRLIMICGSIEAELAELPPEDQKDFLSSMGIHEPGLNRLILAAYDLLGLYTYFTAGEKEVRAWTIKKGMKAPQAAGVIHTDFERGFIRAEVYHCEDLFKLKSESAVKEAGKYRSEGKDYVVHDGDIMLFRFNV